MTLSTKSGDLAGSIDRARAEGDTIEVLRLAGQAADFLRDMGTVVERVCMHYAGYPTRLRKAGGSDFFDENEEACTHFYTSEAAIVEALLDALMRKIG